RLGEPGRPHGQYFEDVDPVADRRGPGSAERVRVVVQVQARDPGERRPRVELRVGLPGEHLDGVAESRQLPTQMPDVDALPTTVWLAPVREQRDPHERI